MIYKYFYKHKACADIYDDSYSSAPFTETGSIIWQVVFTKYD